MTRLCLAKYNPIASLYKYFSNIFSFYLLFNKGLQGHRSTTMDSVHDSRPLSTWNFLPKI